MRLGVIPAAAVARRHPPREACTCESDCHFSLRQQCSGAGYYVGSRSRKSHPSGRGATTGTVIDVPLILKGGSPCASNLLGQARLLLARAAAADTSLVPVVSDTSPAPAEEALAYFRSDAQFRNVRLTELDNGDFATSIVRMLVFTTWRLAVFTRLQTSRDPVLAAVAAKGVKELTCHRDYSARWVVIFGCGTAEPQRRAREALDVVWPYVGELFVPADEEIALAAVDVAVDPRTVREEFDSILTRVLTAAELEAAPAALERSIGKARSLIDNRPPA
ncbi:phenylacetate-CoA oxygenase subunit PaaC [Rhodococcus fascians]|nr:phenylacetate-CoA oxygenase subunit PaaC [Rhodococcus fascians]MBY3824200.1 phenylacetate-CoA oxygenase subunit PaaC [Rhodococcus fascians]MBY3834722.1 phenylacetate-CoA oxygenase subunit PaaC [Rhodococcus fascians]MBY3863934.1 phenylacetate-CoA oxygenase subunit PaaC [Rhodococcus fascians]MBY3883405.1 phenylacetate-CoA oxygenase subunit PaaC [Rhodococcus fascians]